MPCYARRWKIHLASEASLPWLFCIGQPASRQCLGLAWWTHKLQSSAAAELWPVLGFDRSTCRCWSSTLLSASPCMWHLHVSLSKANTGCTDFAGILRMHTGTQEAQPPAGLPWAHTSWQSWRGPASCSCKVSLNEIPSPVMQYLACSTCSMFC